MSATSNAAVDAAKPGLATLLPSPTAGVFLGAFAFLSVMGDRLLRDPDTLIHLAIGQSIALNRALPWTDTFSYTFAGAPRIAKEWLSELLIAGAYALGGWSGVVLLAALAIAVALAFLHGFVARRLTVVPALAVTLVAALLCAPHMLARPHVLALPIIVWWTRSLVEAAQARTTPGWKQILAMLAWANLHGSFTLGFVLAGPIALEAIFSAPPAQRLGVAARWAAFILVALAAACATPYGYRTMAVTLSIVGSNEAIPYIAEWQPLEFDGIGCLAAALMALVLAALMVRPRENACRIVLVTLLAVMALRHCRFLELFALLTPFLAMDPLLRIMPSIDRDLATARGRGARWSTAVMAGLIALAALQGHPVPDPVNTPVAALAAARARGLTAGKVYNAVDFGGFLIANGVQTFIDGRSDMIFLGGFTRTLNEAADGPDDARFVKLIEARGASWALVRTGSSEARHLDRTPRWVPVYSDAVARVFASTPVTAPVTSSMQGGAVPTGTSIASPVAVVIPGSN